MQSVGSWVDHKNPICRQLNNLKYWRGTLDFGIMYWKSEQNDLRGFIEFHWVGDGKTRKSIGGYVFRLGCSLLTWCSKQQPTIALQSIEVEYICLVDRVK
jgi:hypothetical protein